MSENRGRCMSGHLSKSRPISFAVARPGPVATRSRAARHCDPGSCCHDPTVTCHPASLHVRRQCQRRPAGVKSIQTRHHTTMTPLGNRASVRLRVVITSRVTSYGQPRLPTYADTLASAVSARVIRATRCHHLAIRRQALLNVLNEINVRSGARRAVSEGARAHVSARRWMPRLNVRSSVVRRSRPSA
jgi:hypothetical protein